MAAASNSSVDLVAAMKNGDLDRMKELLQAGADLNINRGKGNLANQLTNEDPTDIIILSQPHNIPLHIAVLMGQSEMIKILLSHGANCDCADGHGWTALHLAVTCEGGDIAKLLIQYADLNKRITKPLILKNNAATDRFASGSTPLHIGCVAGKFKYVKALLEQGADVNARDDKGRTPRDVAVNGKNSNIVKLLDEFQLDAMKVNSQRVKSDVIRVKEELRGIKEDLKQLDSMKAQFASMMTEVSTIKSQLDKFSLKAEVTTVKADMADNTKVNLNKLSSLEAEVNKLSSMKTDFGRLSSLKADVASIKTDLDNKLSSLRTEVDHLAALKDKVDDLSTIVEEIFPYKDRLGVSVDAQLHAISQRPDVEENMFLIGRELEYSAREMRDFTAKTETMQLAIYAMFKAFCDKCKCKNDDEKVREIWSVLKKVGLNKDE